MQVAPVEPEVRPAPAVASEPRWLAEPVPPEPALPRPLSPSRAAATIEPEPFEATGLARSPVLDTAEPAFAIARGLAMHKLLQMLPGIASGEREAAALRYLERVGRLWLPGEREAALSSVTGILDHPGFAAIFSGNSRAEVALAGTLTIGGIARSISGKIDRLAVTADAVLVVDYKTNRPHPERLEEVPAAYVAQLALYRALLQPLYPGRDVRAALLFTDGPLLLPLPGSVMDAALARLAGA
jgi:ATP-dependent helicase/nuclease subunit A